MINNEQILRSLNVVQALHLAYVEKLIWALHLQKSECGRLYCSTQKLAYSS